MKTKEEVEFDRVSGLYLRKFGEPYPLVITSQLTMVEHIKRIERCLKTGKAQPSEELDEDKVY